MKEERSRVKRALGVAGDAVFALVLLFCICAAAVLLCLRGEGLAGAKLGIVLLVLLPCAVMLVLLSRELVCILLEPPERTFYRKSFTARLILAPSEVKSRYLAVKNELLSYRDCRARTSWKAESFACAANPLQN